MQTPRQYADKALAGYPDGDFSRRTVLSLLESVAEAVLLDAAELCDLKHPDASCEKQDIGVILRRLAAG